MTRMYERKPTRPLGIELLGNDERCKYIHKLHTEYDLCIRVLCARFHVSDNYMKQILKKGEQLNVKAA